MGKYKTFLFYKQPGMFQINGKDPAGIDDMNECAQEGRIDEWMTVTKNHVDDELGFKFYPDRRTFRRFLVKYAKEDPETFERLFNIRFRADELQRNLNNNFEPEGFSRDKNSNFEQSSESDSIVNPNCLIEDDRKKHIIAYGTYGDCNDCMVCDRDQIWDAVQSGRM